MMKMIDDLFKLLLLFLVVFSLFQSCSAQAQEENPDVALWLARSCAGEAGFWSYQTEECSAILHIYLKRTKAGNLTLYEVVRKYSAATKQRKNHPRKWIFSLDRSDDKPLGWPKDMDWDVYSNAWLSLVDHCDKFLLGEISDPVPEADHYGSKVDEHRALKAGWKFIRTRFRNQFWRISWKKRKK